MIQLSLFFIIFLGLHNFSFAMEDQTVAIKASMPCIATAAGDIADEIKPTAKRKRRTSTRLETKDQTVAIKAGASEITALIAADNTDERKPAAKKKQKTSFYNPQRVRNLYNDSTEKFKISRSKLENFIRCQRCFYLDRKKGVGHPSGYPFNLNIAVDSLLKREFDHYRDIQKPHPYCIENGIDATPFAHADIEKWRNSLRAGIDYEVPGTNILLHGGIDDVWIDNKTEELIIVDYKATSKKSEVSLDADWQDGYKRQMDMYQWLFRKNGFKVSKTGYFVYCNGDAQAESFDKKINFKVSVLPYEGDDSWVEGAVLAAYQCLNSETIPEELSESCDHCQYWKTVNKHVMPK